MSAWLRLGAFLHVCAASQRRRMPKRTLGQAFCRPRTGVGPAAWRSATLKRWARLRATTSGQPQSTGFRSRAPKTPE
eukprot:944233-Alexandrium_andersonii.AAC.1